MTDKHDVVPAKELAVGQARSEILHPLVEALKTRELTPEIVEKMLTLQREYDKDLAKKAFMRALVEMRRDLPPWIERDQTVDYTGAKGRVRYTHASLAGAMEAVLPALTTHGFNLAWTPAIDKEKVSVTATLSHREGHSESATISAPPDMSGNKSSAQGIASTITLLQRYTALALLGIATADMKEPGTNGDAPPHEQPEKIDSARNLRALADLVKGGKSKEEIEKYVGRPVNKWTTSDLDRLRAWISPPAESREPGEDEPEPSLSPPENLDVPVTQKEVDEVQKLMKEFTLGPVAFADLAEQELSRRPKSAKDLTRREFGVLKEAFGHVREGRWDIKGGKFERPPGEEPVF